jgi:hypothetical protein
MEICTCCDLSERINLLFRCCVERNVSKWSVHSTECESISCSVICMLNIFIIKRHTTLDCYFVIN